MVGSEDENEGKQVERPTKAYPTVPINDTGTGWPEEGPARVPQRPGFVGRWVRRFFMLMGVFAIIIAIIVGLNVINLWPSFLNPFASQKTDRSGPVLLKSIQDLSRYVAAEGSFEVLIDLQENKKFIPDILFNERTLFVGAGTVDAYVDFSALNDANIVESADHKSVEVKLPAPVLDKPNLDHDRSYVFAEERGLVNRVGDLFSNDPNRQQQLYQLAEDKLATAARDSELQARAQRNTEAMLKTLLRSLGYETVKITFAPTP